MPILNIQYSPALYPCTPAYCFLTNKTVFSSNWLLSLLNPLWNEMSEKTEMVIVQQVFLSLCTMIFFTETGFFFNALPLEAADKYTDNIIFQYCPCSQNKYLWLYKWHYAHYRWEVLSFFHIFKEHYSHNIALFVYIICHEQIVPLHLYFWELLPLQQGLWFLIMLPVNLISCLY